MGVGRVVVAVLGRGGGVAQVIGSCLGHSAGSHCVLCNLRECVFIISLCVPGIRSAFFTKACEAGKFPLA